MCRINALYSMSCRLDARFWCFTKKQLVQLEGEVRSYWEAKFIKNIFQEQFPYPQEIFDDPTMGPNIYQVIVCVRTVRSYDACATVTHTCMLQQVTALHIKRETENYAPMPGVSWAIMKNFAKHGTPIT